MTVLISEHFVSLMKKIKGRFFKHVSRTIQVKDNFKNAYINNDMLCVLCKMFRCTQSHILQCPSINSKIIVDKKQTISEKFIYGSVDEQLVYVKIYEQFWGIREEMINDQENQ